MHPIAILHEVQQLYSSDNCVYRARSMNPASLGACEETLPGTPLKVSDSRPS
jgi:hypothetical protein